ncbi:MAG: DUF4224 domain-containing protein [Magnetovibrio sp.]|nr:DUF4224 domain-containing protein [Magnetovibrio sp.]
MTHPPIYLTASEIREVTGYRQPGRQIRHLRDQYGLLVKIRADGTPLVARSHFNRAMGGTVEEITNQTKATDEPDFSSLEAAQ